jgi:anti-sigma factor RsiW
VREQDSHAPDEVLEQYSLGTLPEEEAERLEEHLLICQECRDRLEETDAFVEATRGAALALGIERPPVKERVRRRLRWLAQPVPAAAAIAALGLLCWLWWPYGRHAGAPAAVQLQTMRGPVASGARAPASRPLVLVLDVAGVPGSPAYHVEIVDGTGKVVAGAAARRSGTQIAFRTGPLGAGRYWVRVYGGGREVLREYGLEVR